MGKDQPKKRRPRLCIGAVPYMNAKPLIYGLAAKIPQAALNEAVPSRLAPMLARGELDVAMVPVMGYFQVRSAEILPGVCISSRGEVQSVRLFYRGSLRRLQRVGLDASSMTSAALTRIILADRHGLRPEFVSAAPTSDLKDVAAEALLLIGDNAMQVRSRGWSFLDLGGEWNALTGLPFVYAVWAARKGVASPALIRALNEVKANGLRHVNTIARSESRRLGLPFSRCLAYLSERIFYDLGPAEIAGLREFRRRVIAHGLIPKTAKIKIARG